MLTQKKKYNMLKTSFKFFNLISLFEQSCFLGFYHVLSFVTMKIDFGNSNLKATLFNNIFLKKRLFKLTLKIPYLLTNRMFLGNVLILSLKSTFDICLLNTKRKFIMDNSTLKKYNLLPLFYYSSNKFLNSIDSKYFCSFQIIYLNFVSILFNVVHSFLFLINLIYRNLIFIL